MTDKNKTRRLPQKRSKCGECAHYRPLVFKDDGSDAYCGRCTKPSGGRVRQTRSAIRKACDDFKERAGSSNAGCEA